MDEILKLVYVHLIPVRPRLCGFLNGLETFRDTDTLVELCNLVEKGIKEKHESVKRKRSPFFKLTKDLSDSEVAFIGVKL